MRSAESIAEEPGGLAEDEGLSTGVVTGGKREEPGASSEA